jgi:hypothetical protein
MFNFVSTAHPLFPPVRNWRRGRGWSRRNRMVELLKNVMGHWLSIMVASGLVTSLFIL